jgi:hypothetical protein
MSKLLQGFERKSFPIKTKSGKTSKTRGLNPEASTVEDEDGKLKRVLDAVFDYALKSKLEKQAKAAKEESQEVLRTYAKEVRDANAEDGDYNRTYRIFGELLEKARITVDIIKTAGGSKQIESIIEEDVAKRQYAVDATEKDAYTLPSTKEDMQVLREALGDTVFDQLFTSMVGIAVKKEVMDSDALRKELSRVLYEKLGTEGIKKFFDRNEVWKVKPGAAELLRTMDKKVRDTFKEHVKQAADTLKDATEDIKE